MYMVKDKTKTLSLSRKHLTQRVSELLWWWEKNSEESLRGRCCGGGDGRRRWSWIYLWGWVCNRCCVLTFPAIPNQVITAAPPALFSTMTTGVCTRVFERLFVTLLNSVHGWGHPGVKVGSYTAFTDRALMPCPFIIAKQKHNYRSFRGFHFI